MGDVFFNLPANTIKVRFFTCLALVKTQKESVPIRVGPFSPGSSFEKNLWPYFPNWHTTKSRRCYLFYHQTDAEY